MNYIEKEIKLKIDNLNEFIARLKSKAEFVGEAFQKTIRVDTPGKDLEKKRIFLRVRSGFSNVLTLKKKNQNNDNVFAREEIEIKIGDVEKMAEILVNLGFSKQLIMEKYRSEWKYNDTVISVDKMPFGVYVEIEGEEGKIYETARYLGLDPDKKITVTYWDLFEDYKKQNNITGENIIFPKK